MAYDEKNAKLVFMNYKFKRGRKLYFHNMKKMRKISIYLMFVLARESGKWIYCKLKKTQENLFMNTENDAKNDYGKRI